MHNTQTDIHALGGIQTRIASKRAVADARIRPRGRWDRPNLIASTTQIQPLLSVTNSLSHFLVALIVRCTRS